MRFHVLGDFMREPNHLKRQLLRYKDLLANLSRRNRELYYRESKGSTVNLTRQPFSQSAFVEGTKINFQALRFSDPSFLEILKGEKFDLNDYFQTDEVKDAEAVNRLTNRLDKIRLADDRHQREFGISGAWILGPFLCWKTSAQDPREELLISPLFKIPVDLERNKKKNLVLKVEDETISFNPSLRLCLKQKIGLDIPEDKVFDDIGSALEFLKSELNKLNKDFSTAADFDAVPKMPPRFKIVKDENGEIIDRQPVVLEEALSAQDLQVYNTVTSTNFLLVDVMYLDQLNASRTVLINDYDGIIENEINHPILNELFNGTPLAEEPPIDRSKLRQLDAYKEKDNHFVVDIDSTQHRAIEQATKSKAIVIQGPPGTGKSQTIVNLIADYLAKGKKVLFVSDKRPALDVVFNRMKSANIESQAVLIHSSDLNKSDLYSSFLELANSTPNQMDEREWDTASNSLDRVKTEINQYSEALQLIHTESHLSYSDLIILASRTAKTLFNPNVFKNFNNLDHESLHRLGLDLNEVQKILSACPSFNDSPWAYRHTHTVRSTTLEFNLKELLETFKNAKDQKLQLESTFHNIVGENQNNTTISQLPTYQKVEASYASIWKSSGTGMTSKLSELIENLNASMRVLESNFTFFRSIRPGTQPEVVAELEAYYAVPRGFADCFSGMYWSQRKIRMHCCPNWLGGNRQFAAFKEYRSAFHNLQKTLQDIQVGLNIQIENHKENLDIANQKISFLKSLGEFFHNNNIPKKIMDSALNSADNFNVAIDQIAEAKSLLTQLVSVKSKSSDSWTKLGEFISQYPKFSTTEESHVYLEKMSASIDDLVVFDKFDIQISKMSEQYQKPNLKDHILKLFSVQGELWNEVLEASVLNGWADDVVSKSHVLRTFDRTKLLTIIEEFKTSVERHKVSSRQAVHQAFAKRWTTSSDRSGVPLLKKESSKQRKILSPREIMEKGALTTMLQLKPCWLMSPLSISQMLPLQSGLFDVIIFDEASQVRVEDAVPSIYRASSMIVVGDNKQMPPTSFFSGAVVEDDDEEEEISPSVLDLASQVYPSVLLEWHYRSRAEALIAFSNRAFYGGRLIAAPNAKVLTSSGALKYMEVKNAFFTSKTGNEVEADAVVKHLVELLEENSSRSYGVIAMGQSQAVALEEALDRKMLVDSKAKSLIEKAMAFKDGDADAGLFIKNLENVQGDERDVIIMSVGYAPSAEGKKLIMNFGPLSKKGGGRRLNVAVTRAKSQMYIFSSFNPSQIATDEETFNRNPDLCTFGRYLKYAHAVSTESLEVALGILNSFGMSGSITSRKSSRFALDVKRRLEDLGFQVSAEIGSSGFFIDLGIHHPTIPSNFFLGIECDGAVFHSTPYARDRDKIREGLLKERGWRIERVWSQDWSRDWKKELTRLEIKIKMILEQSEVVEIQKKAVNE